MRGKQAAAARGRRAWEQMEKDLAEARLRLDRVTAERDEERAARQAADERARDRMVALQAPEVEAIRAEMTRLSEKFGEAVGRDAGILKQARGRYRALGRAFVHHMAIEHGMSEKQALRWVVENANYEAETSPDLAPGLKANHIPGVGETLKHEVAVSAFANGVDRITASTGPSR